MTKDLVYVFRGNTQERILEQTGTCPVPDDFIYGYGHIKLNKNYLLAPRALRETLYERLLFPLEWLFAKFVRLGCPVDIGIRFKEELQKAACIFTINDGISFGVLANKCLGRVKTPVIVLMQSLAERTKLFENNRFLCWIIAQFLKRANRICTLSKCAQEVLHKSYGVPYKKMSVIYFGIDINFWKPIDEPKEDYFLSVGNDLNRDFSTFVKALASQSRAELITKQQVSSENKNIKCLSGISDLELRSKYQKAICTIVPSIQLEYESSGLSCILQSMACGTPVIASYSRALAELFEDNEHIIFYEAGNAKDLSEKINNLVSNKQLYDRLSLLGKQIVTTKYNSKNMAQQIEDLAVKF